MYVLGQDRGAAPDEFVLLHDRAPAVVRGCVLVQMRCACPRRRGYLVSDRSVRTLEDTSLDRGIRCGLAMTGGVTRPAACPARSQLARHRRVRAVGHAGRGGRLSIEHADHPRGRTAHQAVGGHIAKDR